MCVIHLELLRIKFAGGHTTFINRERYTRCQVTTCTFRRTEETRVYQGKD